MGSLPPKAVGVFVGAQEDLPIRHGRAGVADAIVIGDDVGGEEFKLWLGSDDVGARFATHAVHLIASE